MLSATILLLVVFLVVFLVVVLPAADSSPRAGGEEAAVRQANDAFIAALNRMFVGDVEPMERLWSHADDVLYQGPRGGTRVGWTAVRADWKEQAALELGGSISASHVHVVLGSELAVVTSHGLAVGEDGQGHRLEVSDRALNVFRKEDGEWRLVAHHSDLLPGTVPEADPS